MSTPESRAANALKQRRFAERHPRYWKKYQKRDLFKMPNNPAKYRTFELADPRDPQQLPRLISWCPTTVTPVWASLWSVKDISKSNWAEWLRELDSLGLFPAERVGWSLGSAFPIGWRIAHAVVSIRLRDINNRVTGSPLKAAPWILRNIEAGGPSENVTSPVGCQHPDGTVEHFATISEAARSCGIITRVCLRNWIWTISRDRKGRLWFDD
jgi:hypothetical protein